MKGAESLVNALIGGGIDVCFANPGTSEMHFVAALDHIDGIRCILTLFEGVATGAADGYARMADKPAATLLHLGPGLANGMANLHNASKASTPLLNIVGDHATYHRRFNAPLASDIEGLARTTSAWVRTSADANSVAIDAAAAIAAARKPPGSVSTLILPADSAWGATESERPAPVPGVPHPQKVSQAAVLEAARLLRLREPTLLLLGGPVLREPGLRLAGKLASKTGAKLSAETFNARMQRGAGRISVERIPYVVDIALETLRPFKHIILVGAKVPVAFFAYPGKPSLLAPDGTTLHTLSSPQEDGVHALEWLVDELGAASENAAPAAVASPDPASGAITPAALGQSVAALLPEQAIVVDEGVTTGRFMYPPAANARPHDWLQNMGGSIGIGPPLAVGAAIACGDRKVVALQADGSFMYTLQALWTQAREGLGIVTVVFANRSYAILHHELASLGGDNIGRRALDLIDIDRPRIDWVSLARGMGVAGVQVDTMELFNQRFVEGLQASGPYLIEVAL